MGLGATPASATTLKAPIAGLIDRAAAPKAAYYSVIDGYVVNVNWSDLQAVKDGPITANNPIDQALIQVRSLNASGAHLALKVRILAGINAPDWAKAIGGPVTVTDQASGVTGTVGHFWNPTYENAYANLQAKLAALYDAVPEIREVTISGCMTIYAEPMIRQINNAATVANLVRAGYTLAADETCQEAQIDAHAVWAQTRSDFSFNPYDAIYSATSTGIDEAETETVMSYCRAKLGARCILENNSLRSTSLGKDYDAMYAAIKADGPNATFQTATIKRVGDLYATLSLAASYGAGSVELPSGYTANSASSYASARAALIANSQP